MSKFLKKFIRGGRITPPHHIEEEFFRNFIQPLNIEWYFGDQQYEAIFYKDNTEYVAQYNSDGTLINYRINLSVDNLPEVVHSQLNNEEEIMNVVSKVTNMESEYEVIVRDKSLRRYIIHITESGKILSRYIL
jgi:hypothetical protein